MLAVTLPDFLKRDTSDGASADQGVDEIGDDPSDDGLTDTTDGDATPSGPAGSFIVVTGGGGTTSSSEYRLRVMVGFPQPVGRAVGPRHQMTVGPRMR